MPPVPRAKIAAVLLAVAIVVLAQQLGIFHLTSDPARLKQALLELGPWGYLAFLGAYTVFQPFGVPGTVFVMAAPLIWPWPIAFALSMVGTLSASVVGFSFARFVALEACAVWRHPRGLMGHAYLLKFLVFSGWHDHVVVVVLG
jgi:uncharacterized membrane protein YdjX (TVP38/TMEM64 family)